MFLFISLLVFVRLLGSQAPEYPVDMHWRILPSATSHYIRCRNTDQVFKTQIRSLRGVRSGDAIAPMLREPRKGA